MNNILTLILLFFLVQIISAQVSTGARSFEPESTGEAKINQVLADAGRFFKEGLLNLQASRRSFARWKFDEAVEVFLMSNINVKSNAKLNNCYNQMLETIYRIEFLSVQQPQIQPLAASCGWNIDGQLANAVIKITQTKPSDTATALTEGNPGINQPNYNQVGFSEQVFEFKGDELAQLPPELNQESLNLDLLKNRSQRKPKTVKTANSQTKPVSQIIVTKKPESFSDFAGEKPKPTSNGQYSAIIKYIYDNFHNPYSVKYLNWSQPIETEYSGVKSWQIAVKLRAKNLYNAYRLTVVYFFIRQNKVVFSLDQSDELMSNVKVLSYRDQNLNVSKSISPKGLQIVTAKTGDTIRKIAVRFGVSPVEVAKLNGLTNIDTPLPVGRQIRIQVQ